LEEDYDATSSQKARRLAKGKDERSKRGGAIDTAGPESHSEESKGSAGVPGLYGQLFSIFDHTSKERIIEIKKWIKSEQRILY